MRCVVGCAVVVGMLGVTLGCASQNRASDPEAMVKAADALDRAFVESFNKGDVDALNTLYWNSPDVASFPPDLLEARGIAAVRESNARTAASLKGGQLEITESHNMPVGEAVVGYGKFRIAIPGPDGKPTQVVGRYTDVKAERDGKWVYLIDHASAPLPASP